MFKLQQAFRHIYRNCSSAMVKPPIDVFGTDGRYAAAVFSAASKEKSLEQVEKDLTAIATAFKKDVKFKDFILNPTINRENKMKILKELGSKMSFHKHTLNLFDVLIENKRLKLIPKIVEKFQRIMIAHRQEVFAEVVSAFPLTEAQATKIQEAIKKFLKADKKVNLSFKEDSKIMGGLIIKMDDLVIDLSTYSKLIKYENLLKAPV